MVRRRSRAARQCRAAISRRWPTASPESAAGPISPTAPTGSPTRPNGPSARARSKRGCRDALHERLTQRFVDRRTAVLVRDIGARGADALPVTVAADGEVSVGPEPIGHLAGFDFRVDPSARLADKRLLLAAAERRLGDELDRRAQGAARRARRRAFALIVEDGGGSRSAGRATSSPGSRRAARCSSPRLRTARALDRLSAQSRAALRARLERWLDAQIARHLRAAQEARRGGDRPGEFARRPRAGGDAGRCRRVAAAQGDARRRSRISTRPTASALHRLRVRLGPLDVFVPAAAQARGATLAGGAARGPRRVSRCRACPPPARRRSTAEADPRGAALAYRRLGREWLRIDLADRLASHAHKVRSARRRRSGRRRARDLARPRRGGASRRLMAEIGFARAGDAWRWRGRRGRRAAISAAPRPATPSPRWPSSSEDVRIDRYLHCIRLVKSRTLAQALIDAGHVRIDGKRVAKAERGGPRRQRHRASAARPGARASGARPAGRRGPAAEARACYEELGD